MIQSVEYDPRTFLASASFTELDWLHPPREDRIIIVTFHYYEPFAFTHQGTLSLAEAAALLRARVILERPAAERPMFGLTPDQLMLDLENQMPDRTFSKKCETAGLPSRRSASSPTPSLRGVGECNRTKRRRVGCPKWAINGPKESLRHTRGLRACFRGRQYRCPTIAFA